MKKIIFFLFFPILLFAQVSTNKNIWFAKEFSKELAMYKAKTFLIKEVLDIKEDVSKFEIIPLAASTSGELTTLIYKSSEKEGLILGFFGDYWNDAGVVYQGYKFLNLNRNDATQFLKKINETSIYMPNPHMAFFIGNINNLKYYENNGTISSDISQVLIFLALRISA